MPEQRSFLITVRRAGRRALGVAAAAGLCLLLPPSYGQRPTEQALHGWYVYNGAHAIGPKWELLTDWHYRRVHAITAWQQLLIRGGPQRELPKGFAVGGGYAFVRSHSYGSRSAGFVFDENRLHQQVVHRFKTGSWNWMQRFRVEERWLHLPRQTVYANRIRYMPRVNIPLGPEKKWQLSVYDELFVGVRPNPGTSAFDQNRAAVLLGRRITRNNRLDFGYMHQLLLRRSGSLMESNHTLMLIWNSTTPIRE